jgi:predicted dehydrogenase
MARTAPGAELAALCDLDRGLVEHVRGMSAQPTPGFVDVGAMIEQAKLDGVIISTPQFAHRAVAERCLEAGLHVFIEKPLAHRLDEARALAEAAGKRPTQRFGVGFMKGHDDFYLLGAALAGGNEWLRFIRDNGGACDPAPWFADARRFKDNDFALASPLGRTVAFRASVSLGQVFKEPKGWTFTKEKAGGGVLINTGIHLLFLLRLFFGRLKRVVCLASPIHAQTEDTLSALVEHEDAAGRRVHGTVHISWSVPDCATEATEIVVEGTNGWLWCEDNAARLHLLKKPDSLAGWGLPLERGWNIFRRDDAPPRAAFDLSPEYGGEGYANEIADFVAAIASGRPPRFGAAHGLELQEAIDAYYRSAEAGGSAINPLDF